MSLFDDTMAKAKDVFDVAAKKTEEVVSVQKLKFAISSLNSKINDDFEQLGRVCYDSMANNTDASEQSQKLKNQIDEKFEQIEQLEAQINEQKNTATCPGCGARNPKTADYCAKCGSKLYN